MAEQEVMLPERLPQHIAVIMDGNGRWAQQHQMPRTEGHRAGAKAVRRVIEACVRFGIPYLTLYAFSTENWKRSPDEVGALMDLLVDQIEEHAQELTEQGVRVLTIGDDKGLPPTVQSSIQRICKQTENNSRLHLTIALNYGGRAELVHACRRVGERIRKGEILPDDIDEAMIESCLYTAGTPDPDLVIRPSGEMRLSNFLLWQSAYSEFWSTPVHWPDFAEQDLMAAIQSYASRERRFGGISSA